MKKIVIYNSFLFLLISSQLHAQAVVTTEPADAKSDKELKIIVNVSNVPILAGKPGPMYIWTWKPNDPPMGNGDWGNSNEALKMTKESDNVWSFTMTPSTFYNKPANTFTEINFLVKEKDGNGDKKTADLVIKVTASDFKEPILPQRIFPTRFCEDDVVTIYYDLKIAEKEELKTLTELCIYTGVKVNKADGTEADWQYQIAPWDQVANTPKLQLINEGDNVFSLTFVPKKFYNVVPEDHIKEMVIIFRNKEGNKQTSDIRFKAYCIK